MYRSNVRSIRAVRFGEIGASRVVMKQLVGKEDGAERTALHEIRFLKEGHTSVHTHNWPHQMFVTAGRGVLLSGGRETLIAKGDVVVIGRGEEHGFAQRGRASLVILTVTPL